MAFDPAIVHPDFLPEGMIPIVDYGEHVWPAIICENEFVALKQVIADSRRPMLGMSAAIPADLSDRFQTILEIVTGTPQVRMPFINIPLCYFVNYGRMMCSDVIVLVLSGGSQYFPFLCTSCSVSVVERPQWERWGGVSFQDRCNPDLLFGFNAIGEAGISCTLGDGEPATGCQFSGRPGIYGN